MKSSALLFPLLAICGCSSWDSSQYPKLNHYDVEMIHQVEHLALEIDILANRGARVCLPGQLEVLNRLYLKAKQEAESGFDKDVMHTLIDANEQIHLMTHQLSWLEDHTQCISQATLAQERHQLLLYLAIDNQFALDQTALLPDYREALTHSAAILKRHPSWFVTFTGYTDAKASESYNQDLGLARAMRVKEFLISQGVSPQQLAARSGGEIYALSDADRTQALAERTVVAELSKRAESAVPEPHIHAIRHWHMQP
ncbi:OmpA family protein [Thaumasiovibrio subtropicus]|uniref:OmpA family protein n=1 Tax=Thaumasiovibrio subtropicus TaxID=1891207 RepID=UPI000B3507DD|nr:OmpA family protein [Thaumasiovibrio subtropicus]